MYVHVEKSLLKLLKESIERSVPDASLIPAIKLHCDSLTLDIQKEKDFGDLSCSVAMKLAGIWRKGPKLVAEAIAAKLLEISQAEGAGSLIEKVEVKGAGFINIFLKDRVFLDMLITVHREGRDFGRSDIGRGAKVLLEFVSANPTGALSVAHARQAAVGDALANVLSAVGYDVTREYYLNDAGNQINILGGSIGFRYRELQGEAIDFPVEYYQGSYISDLARALLEDPNSQEKIASLEPKARDVFFRDYGVEQILEVIRGELDGFGVHFDVWYSQKVLDASGKVEQTLEELRAKQLIYDAEGAVWFKSTAFGDDKDRVVRKSDGSYTYLAPDIAYHRDKFRRGFERLINIWGPDHHGYIPRMKAAVQAMGHDAGALSVIIVQLATLFREGQPVPMSTRKGQYVTLTEVLTEVGRDAARFFFLMRKTDSHLDFDLTLAKKQVPENPVFYVQYAHARICGILNGAKEQGLSGSASFVSLLKEEEERDLMKVLFSYGYGLLVSAKQLDPYSLTTFLQSLASAFHRFYDRHKVLSEDSELTQARLFLVGAVKIVFANGLGVLGVSAPERM